MPGFVKTPADEKKWARAKALAKKSNPDNMYAVANHIFQNVKKSESMEEGRYPTKALPTKATVKAAFKKAGATLAVLKTDRAGGEYGDWDFYTSEPMEDVNQDMIGAKVGKTLGLNFTRVTDYQGGLDWYFQNPGQQKESESMEKKSWVENFAVALDEGLPSSGKLPKGSGLGSFIGTLKAGKGTLLGGVKVHRSSRFKTRASAQSWLKQAVKGNRDAGRDVASSGVETSTLAPQIDEGGAVGAASFDPHQPRKKAPGKGAAPFKHQIQTRKDVHGKSGTAPSKHMREPKTEAYQPRSNYSTEQILQLLEAGTA